MCGPGGGGGGGGGSGPPLEFAKLNIDDITGNEKNSYFSYLCTSTVIRQGWTPIMEKFSGSAPAGIWIHHQCQSLYVGGFIYNLQ